MRKSLILVLSQALAGHEPVPLPAVPLPAYGDVSESYYEEAQPYGETFNGKTQRQTVQLPMMEACECSTGPCLCCH